MVGLFQCSGIRGAFRIFFFFGGGGLKWYNLKSDDYKWCISRNVTLQEIEHFKQACSELNLFCLSQSGGFKCLRMIQSSVGSQECYLRIFSFKQHWIRSFEHKSVFLLLARSTSESCQLRTPSFVHNTT